MHLPSLFPDTESTMRLAAGETIFRKGDDGITMYVIIEGTVDLVSDVERQGSLGPGDLFGEMSLIDDEPRSLSAIAATDVSLAEIDERRFLFLVHEAPTFALHVLGVMADRLRHR